MGPKVDPSDGSLLLATRRILHVLAALSMTGHYIPHMTSQTHKTVTAFTRAAMGVRGTRLVDLADALDLSVRSVSARLAGDVSWTVEDLDRLASYWRRSVEDLLAEGRQWVGQFDGDNLVTAEMTPRQQRVSLPAEVTRGSELDTRGEPCTAARRRRSCRSTSWTFS